MKVACVFLVLVLCCVSVSAQQQTIVETISTGSIAGYTQNGLNYFLGIPYAQPPIGSLRFAAPVPAQKWAQTINTQQYGTTTSFPNTFKTCIYLSDAEMRLVKQKLTLPRVKFSQS